MLLSVCLHPHQDNVHWLDRSQLPAYVLLDRGDCGTSPVSALDYNERNGY
jgi:hypothetical protein